MKSKTLELRKKMLMLETSQERLEVLRGAFEGETAYIVAAGPSLKDYTPEYLNDVLSDKLVFSIKQSFDVLKDTVDFHFGACQLIAPIGNPTTNNLFNMYWAVYYNELYNPDTRIMTIKVNLNPADINMFNFFDTVMIKNREFRVNKIEYKPHDLSTVEFILIP